MITITQLGPITFFQVSEKLQAMRLSPEGLPGRVDLPQLLDEDMYGFHISTTESAKNLEKALVAEAECINCDSLSRLFAIANMDGHYLITDRCFRRVQFLFAHLCSIPGLKIADDVCIAFQDMLTEARKKVQ